MKTSRDIVFAPVEPPQGGVERMASRFAAAPRRSPAAAVGWAAAAAAVVAAAVLVPLRGHFDRPAPPVGGLYAAPEFDRLLGRNTEPYELSVSVNQQKVRVAEVPTSDPKIRIYALQN
jgi:hypothetical protein